MNTYRWITPNNREWPQDLETMPLKLYLHLFIYLYMLHLFFAQDGHRIFTRPPLPLPPPWQCVNECVKTWFPSSGTTYDEWGGTVSELSFFSSSLLILIKLRVLWWYRTKQWQGAEERAEKKSKPIWGMSQQRQHWVCIYIYIASFFTVPKSARWIAFSLNILFSFKKR